MTDIRQMLIDANPVPARVEVPDVIRAELMAEVHRTPPPRRRFTRRWQWPLPTILVALIAAGGVATAAALLISQETKDKSTALASGPAMALDITKAAHGAAQFKATADRIMATTPYPPGMPDRMDWAAYGRGVGGPGEVTYDIQMLVEHRATCLWRKFWLRAHASGQTVAANDAAKILREALTWPSMQVDRGVIPAIGRQVASAAARGDEGAVRALSRIDCNPMPLPRSSPRGG